MGIETGVALLIGSLVSAAAAGVGAQQAHAGQVHAAQTGRDQAYQQTKLQDEAKAKEDQAQLGAANIAARQRQRALASSYGGAGPGVTTNPLGDVGQATTRQSSLLGG